MSHVQRTMRALRNNGGDDPMLCKRCGINETTSKARPCDACHEIISNELYYLPEIGRRLRRYAPRPRRRKP